MRTLARALGVLVVTASLLIASGPMQARALPFHEAHAAVAVPAAPAAPTPQGYTRIRHYTNKAGFDRIAREGVIRARDKGRVFGENARNRPLSPRDAEDRYKLRPGSGNHYIETDVPKGRISRVKNPTTRKPELRIKGDVPLRNPSGKCQ